MNDNMAAKSNLLAFPSARVLEETI